MVLLAYIWMNPEVGPGYNSQALLPSRDSLPPTGFSPLKVLQFLRIVLPVGH